MNANEIIKTLKWLAKDTEFIFAAESLMTAADLIEALQVQLAEIAEKPERTSPVKYYTEGKPYVQIGGLELRDHPVAEACARLDRYEKYIIPHLQEQLAESQCREMEVDDIADFIIQSEDNIRIAMDAQDRQYLENIIISWRRGPEDGEPDEKV